MSYFYTEDDKLFIYSIGYILFKIEFFHRLFYLIIHKTIITKIITFPKLCVTMVASP